MAPTVKHRLIVRADMLSHMVASGKTFARGPGGWQIFSSVTSWADGYAEGFAATAKDQEMFACANTCIRLPEKKLRS
ncbi:hypothetical protein QQ44_03240 [Mycolicibacterium setense]|uniref:Uncharacterized protein n=1 Tax=Mycolicibacterium setense TaxID=431269 RepID=A0ABR4Z0E3_9MYCO|nr:hypothetical protein QQ44_03240 [Mycolicibacterium setense]